jgi:3',5'-cyclic AMP phosphodiesterase CpdA
MVHTSAERGRFQKEPQEAVMTLSLAVTADLHWGHRRGQEEVQRLADFVRARPPDVFVIAGDLGSAEHFAGCLALFRDLPSRKVLVPGNHDLWVRRDDIERDSLLLYEQELPKTAAEHGFHYLDAEPLYFAEVDLALVGSVNWYDYTWGIEGLRRHFPAEEYRLKSKRFTRGRHNDANFVRWPTNDEQFTGRVVAAFERQLTEALVRAGRAIVFTHHPPFYDLTWERDPSIVELDAYLWDAFIGNRSMEEVLRRHADRVSFAFCGHTHRQREATLNGIRGHNIGGDYHFKRLLWLDWPAGTIETHQFGDPAPPGG